MHHSCTELSILRIYKDGISAQHVALKDQFSSKCLYILLQIPSKRTSTEGRIISALYDRLLRCVRQLQRYSLTF